MLNVKLKNATGASINVDIDISDTPIQIINKAIEQCGDNAAIIMRDPGQFNDLRSGEGGIQETESSFAIDSKTGNRPLEFNLPIQDQIATELTEVKASGRPLEFIVAVALIVGV